MSLDAADPQRTPGSRVLRVGLIADTHMPPFDPAVCAGIERCLSGVELILHAGDLVTLGVLDWLEGIAPVLAARGNNDRHLPADRRLADYQCVELDGVSVGVTHVLEPLGWDLGRLADRYGIDPVPQVLVFGDSHYELVEWRDDTLLVNPGSPTTPHLRVDRPGTVAVLTIDEGRPAAELVVLDPSGAR